ncbi:Ig-like domain-containing protein [Pseudorhodoferax sp. Leaf267]|uniref:Ig-like domain-containing protein n=1 Tax=Pseudorhodoferax sp. Leaf267 TaxID=1736316 RepID=UPI001F28B93A|nr:Ig-like domain-containing protein [Pseudorhodoferax sp. Leaf267]
MTRTAIPVDTTPPSVNTLALVSDTGSSTTDGITRDPRVQGTVSDNVAVTRLLLTLDAGTEADLSSALNAGAFTLSAAQLNTLAGGTLAQGAHTLSVVAVDAAGNRSTARTLAFTLDTSAPTAAIGLAPASDTGTVGDLVTESASVTLVGTAAAGTVVQFGARQATADAAGGFSFTGVALALGSNSFAFTLTDPAGNTGTASVAVQRSAPTTVDTQAPVVATLSLVNDSGRSATDGITNDVRIAGTVTDNVAATRLLVALDPGATPTFTNLSAALGTGGAFSITAAQLATLAGGTLAQGAHTLRVVAEDAAGNRSAAVNLAFTLDSVAPTGGSFGVSITDAVGGNTSQSDAAIAVLAGTVEANATVTLAAQGLSVVASGTGAFQLPGVALAEGDNRITLGVLDAAGNSTSIVRTITRVAPSTFADPVLAWNQIALQSIQRDVTTPEEATRILAMQSLAVYDTLAAIDGTAAYMVQDKVTGPVSVEAAVAQAAYQILYAFYPSQRGILDAALASSLATIADGAAKTAGIALGERVAKAIVVIRANDGYLDYAIDDGGTALGQWRPTGPMYLVAEHPQWGSVTPFALDSADQFRAPPPPALTSAEYAAAEEQVRLYGGETSALRTADQTQMAQFWADGGGSYTPPGHWNLIAQQIAASKGAGLAANARMMAQLNVALADAAIACWDTKYTYDFWRPVTAIHNADLDNNPGTQVDANWRPLLITPPHPDYVSGHSTFSAAAAGILSATFGANTAFSTISVTVPGVTRSFTSFQQAAQEAGMSRIYAGIHTIFANNEGAVIGGKVADAVLARFALTEDTQAPNIVLADSPANTNANLVLTGQVLDNLSGVASLQYRVDNGALTNLARASDGSFTITTALALNGSADGAHSITLVARDAAGNTSAGTTRSFVLDTRAPTVALASIAANAVLDANSRLVGQADATGTAVVALSYSFDGGAAKTITYDSATGRFDQALPLGDLSVGAHSLRLVATDAAGNSTTLVRSVSIAELAPFTITKFTPEDAKREIGSTFRPQVFFSRAVNAATLTADSLYATGPDGSKLAMTIVPALDGSFAWLLPQSPMPGGSTITLHVKGSAIRAAQDGAFLDAGGNGTAGGDFTWTFTTVSTTAVIGTKLVGRVVDPGADLLPMTFDDIRRGPDGVIHTPDDVFLNPIAGAKVWIIGQEDKVVYTDAQGFFELDGVPVGNVKLAIDGRTATNPPAGIFFPEMVMDLDLKPGIANTAMGSMGKEESRIENADRREIYLPRVQSSALQPVSDTATTVITVDENSAPGIIDAWREAMTLTVTPGAAIGFDGQPLANVQIGINTVPPELVREMLPPGVLEHTFDITIQAPGVDTFAAPLKITFPNVFNSAPGTKLNVMSFDHTTGRLVINGTATVSADGLTVVSDEGSGILAPGWHGLTPPGPRGGNDKPRPPTPPNPPTPPLPPLPPLPPVPPIIPWFPLPWTPVPPIGPTTPPNQSTPTPGIVSPIGGTPNRFTGFNIDLVDVTQTLTPAQEVAVGQAIGVWESIITTDIPSALTVYGLVDDLRIDLRVVAGDGAGGTLGGATILERRPGSMGLPALAEITIDVADLAAATPAELRAIMLHEIGHALGLGELWAGMGLVNTTVAGNPRYTGAAGVAAFSALMGSPQTSVPLDNRSGASPTHWRESVFGNELMTPLLDSGIATPLSALTVAALADMGYTVNTAAAQAYTLPGAGFPFHPGTLQPANTTDGELLQADAGGAGLAVVAAAATLDDHVFRAFDFGAGGTAAGFTAVGAAQVYSTASGYGWRTANSASSATTGGNALTGDFAQTRDATFSVAVANGTYDIVLTLGDDASARDRMSYELQGVRRGAVSTVAGEHITMTHRVEVHNGVLDLRLFSEFGPVALNALEVHQVSDYVTPASSVSYTSGHYYFAIHNLDTGLVMRDNTVVAEGGAVCPDGVVLAPNTRYRQYVYHVETNTIGISDYVTPASGNDFDLPEIVLGGRFTPDADADGLEDLAEFIVGTRADRRDTDGDGIADRAELQQQLDPLGGLSIQPGVVASAALLGTAQAVAVSGTGGDTGASLTAYVATGSYGLAVVDVSQTTAPAVRAQLDLSGNNVDVAVDAVRQLALVAAGDAGLHIVDVRDPTAPVLRQTLVFDGSVQNVRIRDGLAFVSAGANLAVVDLNTGDVLQTLNLANQGGGAVTGLALDGATLYSMDSTRTLRSFAIAGNQLATRDTLALAEGGTQIFAGGGVVYVGTGTSFQQGFLTVNAADPANLVLLSGVDQAGTAGQSLAANGSGLLVSVGALRGPVGQALNVLDVSNVRDPANTGAFVTRYNLPNPPEGVALANGFAFVAGGAGGLQIVSYIGFDAAGVAPTLSVAIDGVDADPSTPGIQVLEGRNVQIRPTVVDDVQVRNVELLVNGVVVSNDAAFPFELLAQVPTIASGGNQMTLQVRATDTGGNVTLSAVTTLRVVPDTFAPLLQSINLAEGARRFFVRSVDLQFDEPLDTARLAASGVTLLRAGADGRFGTADDVRVAVRLDTRAFGQALSILPESFLTAGEYRLTITPSIVADRAGNALAAPIVRNFTVRPASNVQAAVGLPEVAQAPSANPGQEIGINVPFDPSTARAQFTTLDANGTRATTVVNARRFDAATGTAYFMVPFNAASGDIVVYGQEGSVRTDFDDGTLPLQIVPIVSGVQVQSVASDGSSAVIVLTGMGFAEGNGSEYRIGGELVTDGSVSAGPNVTDRYDPVLNQFIANGSVTLTVPLSAGVFGAISVRTVGGGTSASYSVSLSSITSVALSGTPANAALASANAGQAIVLNGTGLSTGTDVLLRYTDYQGNLSMVRVSPTSAAGDGTRATLVLPANVNGAFALQVFGSATQPVLQIVPTLHAFTENGFMALSGSGFVEGASTITLPGATVADTATNAGVDVTYGYDAYGVYGENNLANIPLANTPRYGQGSVTLSTAGGTSAALALNLVRPGSNTAPTGLLSDIAVDRSTGATWVLDSDNPDHLLRINTATGAIVQSITLTSAMGPYTTSQGYAGLQINPGAFSLGGVNVPAGSLVLLNGYGRNHVTALNPATGAVIAQLDLAGSYITSGVLDAATGRIFATTNENTLGEFNATTGALVQSFDLPFNVTGRAGMAIDPASGNLWIGSQGSGTSIVLVNRQGQEIRRVDLASQGVTNAEISGLAFLADGTLRVASTQGTVAQVTLTPDIAVQAATLSAITAAATDGVPAQAGVASANVGQLITLSGTNFNSGTRVLFGVRYADGSTGQVSVNPLAINDAGTRLQVLVPELASTGDVRVVNRGTRDLAGSTSWTDSVYRNVTVSFTAGASTAAVRFADGGLQGVNDESWGIDNVRVARGATTVFSDDFEGAANAAWSNAAVDLTERGTLTRFAGRFSNDSQTLNLTGLTAGQTYTLRFDLYVLDSWAASNANDTDLFEVSVDGVNRLRESFANADTAGGFSVQSFGASAAVRLQIVPTLTGVEGRPGENAVFTLNGSGFMEGASTVTVGGVAFVDDAGTLTPFDVSGPRNSSMTAVAPRTLDGPVRITTEGGYAQITPQFGAQPLSLFTAIVASANNAGPANNALPSANTAQTIVLQGQGFTNATLVQFQGRDDTGATGTLTRTGSASADGRTLSVIVPAQAVTGNVSVLGSGNSIALQVVPLVRSVGGTIAAGNTIVLEGIGLSAADLAITVGGRPVTSYTLRTVIDGVGTTRDLQLVTLTVPTGAVGREVSVATSGGGASMRTGALIANLGAQTPAADPSDTAAGAASLGALRDARLTINATVGDGANGQRDVDLYSVTLGARVMLRVNMTTATYGTVRLFDAAGNEVATRTFSPNDASVLQFTAPNTGTYTIGVSGLGNTSYNPASAGSGTASPYTGAYSLNVEAQSLGSVRLATVLGTAAEGTPGNTAVASANPGQAITLTGAGLVAGDRIVFMVVDAAGNIDELAVTPTSVDVAAQTITVTVPDTATTGRLRLERDTNGMLLQIVPRVTDVQVQSVASDGSTATVVLSGYGFLDGADSLYRFGSYVLKDAGADTGPDVQGRSDPVRGFIANGQVTVTVPLSDGVFGGISVQTVGGTSTLLSRSLASITAVAASGTPANAAQASANAGQSIVLNGSGLSTATDVLIRYTDYQGNPSMVRVSPTTAAADGSRASLTVPLQVNGAYRLQVFGSASQPLLQIVPTLRLLTEDGTLHLAGSGFAEGGTTLVLPGATLVDRQVGIGADITYGYDVAGNYLENHLINVSPEFTPRYGQGNVSVRTAGGTSAPLASNVLRPGSDSAAAGNLSDIAVNRTTGATWVLDGSNPGRLLRIDPATGAIAQTIVLTTAMGPYVTAQGYAGLQINPSAFSLGGVSVPAGSLVLVNGYGRNHVTALNPATGAVIAQLDLAGSYLTSGVLDASTGRIFATTSDNRLSEFNAATGALVQGVTLPFTVTGNTGMAIDPASGHLWVGASGTGTSIVLLNRAGVEQRRVDLASQGIDSGEISGLAFAPDGTLRVSSTRGTVYSVTVA